MFSKFRSLIFKIDPETAHNLAIKSLRLNLTPNLKDENKDDPMFKTKLFGKEIDNPKICIYQYYLELYPLRFPHQHLNQYIDLVLLGF